MPMAGPTTDHHEIRNWADDHLFVPVEMLPHRVDHEPAWLRLVPQAFACTCQDLRKITWEDFFAMFDQLGLALVYDSESTGENELLQVEGKSPYRNPKYSPTDSSN